MARAKQRWLPALLIPLALLAAVLVGTVQAGATPTLPPKSAEEIVAMIARTEVRAFSGTVLQSSKLGLPDLNVGAPGGGQGEPSLFEFLTGSHEARIYVAGPSKARLQVLDRMAERDVVVNGTEAWFYSSADNSAVHTTLPARPEAASSPAAPDDNARNLPSPEALADRFLETMDDHTEVSVGEPATVAGRGAYTLMLVPRSTDTLVDRIAINVDSETGFPLGVTVRAKGQADPTFSASFSSFDPGVPDPALFTFTPPPGATVKEAAVTEKEAPTWAPRPKTSESSGPAGPRHPSKDVSGQGWDSVVVLPAGSAPQGLVTNPQLAQALQPVAGGRALTTSLVSVLILDDGRVFAGMVPLERLQDVAGARGTAAG